MTIFLINSIIYATHKIIMLKLLSEQLFYLAISHKAASTCDLGSFHLNVLHLQWYL